MTWRTLATNAYSNAYLDQLVSAISLARNTAIAHNTIVTLCPSRDKLHCTKAWSDGQIVFIDEKGNGTVEHDSTIIATFRGEASGHTLQWRTALSTPYLQFNPDGSTRAQPGTFIDCPAYVKGEEALVAPSIVVSKTGRVRFTHTAICCNLHD